MDKIPFDLLGNDYFKAGTGLFGIALGSSILRRGAQVLHTFLTRNFTMTMEIPNHDKSYTWVSQWVSKQTRTTHISVETEFNRNESGKIITQYQFIPSPGVHYLFLNKRIIKAERARTQPTMSQSGGTPFESLTLTTVGRDRSFYQYVLGEAKKEALLSEEGWTIVYKAVGAEWRHFGYPRARRPLSSVILDEGLSENLLKDVKEFQENEQWYRDRGIPYRRGYLLYGPPGCGKSSFIAALAGELEYSICVLSLSELGMSGDRLDYLLSHAPLQSVILLEDVDAAFGDRSVLNENPAYQGMIGLTLSGLLNALDGVASTEGRILFMTTNYPDRLDAALVRPGRVDYKLKLDLCSIKQLELLFLKFYPNTSASLAKEFADLIGANNISAAQVQGFLLCFKESPNDAIKHIDQLLDSSYCNLRESTTEI